MGEFSFAYKSIKFNSVDNVAVELKKLKVPCDKYGEIIAGAYSESPYKSKMLVKGFLKNSTKFDERNNLISAARQKNNAGIRLEVVKAFKESNNRMDFVTGLALMTKNDAALFFKDFFDVGGKISDVTEWLANISEIYINKKRENNIDPDHDGFWDDLWDAVVGAGKTIGEAINTVVDAVIDAGKAISEVIDDVLTYSQQTINNIIEAFIDAGKEVWEIIKSATEVMTGNIKDALEKIFKGILSAGKTIYDILKALSEDISDFLKDGVETLLDIGSSIKNILKSAWKISREFFQDVIEILVNAGRSVWYILNRAKSESFEALVAAFEKLLKLGISLVKLVAWCVRRSYETLKNGFKALMSLGLTIKDIVKALIAYLDNVFSKGLRALMELGGTLYEFFEAAKELGGEFVERIYNSLKELGMNLESILKKIAEQGYEFFKKVVQWLRDAGIKILDTILFACGFDFDDEQEIYYSRVDAWQSNVGYFTLYDYAAPLVLMIIHCEPIVFEYAGKGWKIEFWKGQYGILTGAEIGIYTGEFDINTGVDLIDHTLNAINFGEGTDCATGGDMLQMSFSLRKGNEIVFTRNSDNPGTGDSIEKHWWLTGFKPLKITAPSDLQMDLSIVLKDIEMANVFAAALERVGYSKGRDLSIDGQTVSVVFDVPYTEQPW